MKIKLNKSTEDFFQVYASNINDKWIFFPKVYKKLGNSEYQEMSIEELPEGIKKYIKEYKDKNEQI